jgi:hypothetical protein
LKNEGLVENIQNINSIENIQGSNQQILAAHREKAFDMYNLNPDWKFAENHGEAVKPGISRRK